MCMMTGGNKKSTALFFSPASCGRGFFSAALVTLLWGDEEEKKLLCHHSSLVGMRSSLFSSGFSLKLDSVLAFAYFFFFCHVCLMMACLQASVRRRRRTSGPGRRSLWDTRSTNVVIVAVVVGRVMPSPHFSLLSFICMRNVRTNC